MLGENSEVPGEEDILYFRGKRLDKGCRKTSCLETCSIWNLAMSRHHSSLCWICGIEMIIWRNNSNLTGKLRYRWNAHMKGLTIIGSDAGSIWGQPVTAQTKTFERKAGSSICDKSMRELKPPRTASNCLWQGIPNPRKKDAIRSATEISTWPVAAARCWRSPVGGRRNARWVLILSNPVIFEVQRRLKNVSDPPSKSLGI